MQNLKKRKHFWLEVAISDYSNLLELEFVRKI